MVTIYNVIVLSGIAGVFLVGAVLYWHACTGSDRRASARSQLKRYRAFLVKELVNETIESLFKEMNIGITGLMYQVFRYSLLLPWLLYLVYMRLIGTDVAMTVVFWTLLYFISSPRRRFLGRDSPFLLVVGYLNNKRREKYDREIYRCLSQLKNIAIAKDEASFSADYVLCEMAKYAEYTKSIFNRMIGYWYEGRYQNAVQYFITEIPSEAAKVLASLIIKMDQIKLSEFLSQIDLYQTGIKEKRRTDAQAAKERRSNLVYAVVVITAVCIFLNFLFVSIAIDAFELYKNMSI